MINTESLQAIETHLVNFFAKHQFVRLNGDILKNSASDFFRKVGQNDEMVRCGLQTDRSTSTVLFADFVAMKKYEIIEHFLDNDDHQAMKAYEGIAFTVRVNDHFPKKTFEFREEEVNNFHERTAIELTDYIEKQIFPALKYYDDIRALDAEANESMNSIAPIFHNLYWFHKMIIAKLAGNPMYDALSKSVIERFERGVQLKPDNPDYKNYLGVARKVHSKLQATSPLSNPMIG